MANKFMKSITFIEGGDAYYPLPKVTNADDGKVLKVVNGEWSITDPIPTTYLSFIGTKDFGLKTVYDTKNWDGTLEYSTDTITWRTWDGTEISSVGGKLYLRGIGNTKITGDPERFTMYAFRFVVDNPYSDLIICEGNIENLLDYETVSAGGHPTMADYCFEGLFSGCTSLATAPELPATTLSNGCYNGMFYGCTSLTTAPALPATTLAAFCYASMFQGCTKIKLSTTQTGEYQTPYRMPTSGTGTAAADAFKDMFTNTGGTFTGTPEINTTYYTSNTVV